MEQPQSRKDHRHPVLLARGDDVLVAQRSAGLDDVLDPADVRAIDAVAEGEEGVGPEGDAPRSFEPGKPLLSAEPFWDILKSLLPERFFGPGEVVPQVAVDGVVAVHTI